jgi:hypothetical protein
MPQCLKENLTSTHENPSIKPFFFQIYTGNVYPDVDLLLCLSTIRRDLLHRGFPRHDVLNRGQDGRPVFKDCERHIFPHAVGDEIWIMLGIVRPHRVSLTVSLLCKQQIGLLCRREVRHPVSSVEHRWPLPLREIGVLADLDRLVVAEVAVMQSVLCSLRARDCSRHRHGMGIPLTSRRGRQSASRPPH